LRHQTTTSTQPFPGPSTSTAAAAAAASTDPSATTDIAAHDFLVAVLSSYSQLDLEDRRHVARDSVHDSVATNRRRMSTEGMEGNHRSIDTKQSKLSNERPHVTLTYAQSLDGFMAPEHHRQKEASPFILSGSDSMIMTHRYRILGIVNVLDIKLNYV
jgi:hypothetical protein